MSWFSFLLLMTSYLVSAIMDVYYLARMLGIKNPPPSPVYKVIVFFFIKNDFAWRPLVLEKLFFQIQNNIVVGGGGINLD